MSVRLLFPTMLWKYNLVEEGLITEEYLCQLKDDMDGLRKKDPVGRFVSNAHSGWQSNDGTENRPIWHKLYRIVQDKFNHEVLPFHNINTEKVQVSMGNMWMNINTPDGAWNRPHRHNGCWYSGAFYIQAEGGEGNILFTDKNDQALHNFPHNSKVSDLAMETPISGTLLLFPSGLVHMVEPNFSNKSRYSVAFNMIDYRLSNEFIVPPTKETPDWNLFEVDGDQLKK